MSAAKRNCGFTSHSLTDRASARSASESGGEVRQEFAFVTPSFPPDRERCALLVESLDRCCPEAEHYLIIDRYDMPYFRGLASSRTKLIQSEEVIEDWLHRFPTRHGYWWSLKTWPVRGWIMQQIRKIAVANVLTVPNIVYCDSDMAFIRPFGLENLMVDGQLGLIDVPYQDENVRRWTKDARLLLGIQESRGDVRGHVGQMIVWRRENVLKMQARIEATHGMSWQQAIARRTTISEYVLYGVYVREFIGYEPSGHKPSQVPLVKTSWDMDITTSSGLDAFFTEFDPRTIAIMAHSKDPIDQVHLRRLVEAQWVQSGVL